MEIKCVAKELNEEFVKEMTILKLEKNYGFIEREEFQEEIIALGLKYGFSDYAELLSFISFKVIVDRIDEMQSENVRILFNETIEVPYGDDFIPKTCDVILIGRDVIEVITLISAKVNVISSYDNEEIKPLGIGVIDKFLSRMECSKIRFITIQPNLDLCSIYETTIERMLHEYDFGLQIIHGDNSIVLLAQSNRIVDKKDGDMAVEKIDSSDIKDSARIEQDSDQVRALYSIIVILSLIINLIWIRCLSKGS